MEKEARLNISIDEKKGIRNQNIFGHFIEHFHRQIYGGIFDPNSPLSDENGFRKDVISVLKKIKVPVLRWPGGCFVSAYPWKKGVGNNRIPYYDKAWRVEEPNTFGTDEFIEFCQEIGAEPYICTNAGTGSPEEMSDWVEYCNQTKGEWANLRKKNGHLSPYSVKYWSIGNENYGSWEMGAKSPDEWARFVLESAKMMKRVDTDIELSAASTPDLDWNLKLLKDAGHLLDWISIHGYWSKSNKDGQFESDYSALISRAFEPENRIKKTEHILGALDLLGKIKITFDEWNLRNWFHPGFMSYSHADHKMMDKNDINSNYTMADAVFTACFLNSCLRHCDNLHMANFSPVVNTVGAIFTHPNGIVLRSTYHVFDLFTNHTFEEILHSVIDSPSFTVPSHGEAGKKLPYLDSVVTHDPKDNQIGIILVNLHEEDSIKCRINGLENLKTDQVNIYSLSGDSANSFNSISQPDNITVKVNKLNNVEWKNFDYITSPHSVSIIKVKY